MRPVQATIVALIGFAAVSPMACGQDAPAPSPSAQELQELRQAVQQQTKQIEILAEQVGKLTRALENQKTAEPTVKTSEATPTPAPAAAVAPSPEATKPAPEASAEAPKIEGVPKAEAVPGTKHAVAKGETLTSIAKHYNISIADLKNANKINDERKLQIGQILSIPTAKTPDTTDKKENP